MSDETQPEPENEWGEWGGDASGVAPQPGMPVFQGAAVASVPSARQNHTFTLSVAPDKAPFLVIRADTTTELNALLTQLEMHGCWANIAAHNQSLKAHGTVGAGLGHVTPVPMAGQPPQVTPQGIPMMPQAQFGAPLGAGGMPGTAPSGWQNAGAPAPAPAGCPPGWYTVRSSFQEKAAFDAVKGQLMASNMRNGNMKWDGNAKCWYVSPQVVQYFAQFSPQQG